MRYRMGDLVEQVTEMNSDLKYGLNDIVGVTLEKQMIPTIANLTQTNLDNFIIVHPKDFVYNPRTHGKKIGLGFNTTDRCFISTWNNNTFRVKPEMSDVIMPEYLYMYFLREKWDKEACFNAWGSSTVVLLWSSFCDMKINVPSLPEQRKIVHDYQVITDRIELLRKMNDNLVACIDTIFNEQFGNFKALAESSTANTDFSSLPDGWTIENAVHSFDISIGKTPPRSEPEWFTSNQTDNVWISIADMKTNSPFIFKSAEYLTNEAVKKHNVKIVPANSVLLSFKMTVGRVAIVTNEVTTNEAIAHFPCTKENLFFVYCYLKNFNYGYLGSTSSITTAINSKIIKEMPFLMPSKKELDLFNHKVSGLFEQLKYISKELDILEELSKMLLPQLLGHC